MPAGKSGAATSATAVAPDGIAIHTFDLPAAKLLGIVEGRIPTGRFAIHRHLTVEQYTYVVAGRVTAITSDSGHPDGRALKLESGDLLLTAAGETLQFVNDEKKVARVLFICSPPYPADDSDTRLAAAHAPMTADDAREALERIEQLRVDINAELDARIGSLSKLEQRADEGPAR